jgi:hypothetical protein
MVGAEMLAGKSYFGKSGREQVPIAVRSLRDCWTSARRSAGSTGRYMVT